MKKHKREELYITVWRESLFFLDKHNAFSLLLLIMSGMAVAIVQAEKIAIIINAFQK